MNVSVTIVRPVFARNARGVKEQIGATPVITRFPATMTSTKTYRTDQVREQERKSAGIETKIEQLVVLEDVTANIQLSDILTAQGGPWPEETVWTVYQVRPYENETQLTVRSYE